MVQVLHSMPIPSPPDGRKRFRPDELATLTVRLVRPLVEVGQQTVLLHMDIPPGPVEIGLHWLERYGGTFGPRSSAEAASRRFRGSTERSQARNDEALSERHVDRGRLPAWIAYLSCPTCGKRCTVLRAPLRTNAWACWKCLPQLAPLNVQQGGPRSQKKANQHRYWATKIRHDYMGFPQEVAVDLHFQPMIFLNRPKGCRISQERWRALRRLAAAHEMLWQLAELDTMSLSLSRLPELRESLTLTVDEKEFGHHTTRWAQDVIRIDSWALRQTNWHRRGLPREVG